LTFQGFSELAETINRASSSTSAVPSTPKHNGNNKKRKWSPEKPAILGGDSKKDVFWYPSMVPPEPIPDNFTPG
jgi:hypothetical protein